MVEYPHFTITEETGPYYPSGSGAQPIIAIGKTPLDPEPTKVYKFVNYEQAALPHGSGGIGASGDNPLLDGIKAIFEEGMAVNPVDGASVGVVYAINLGQTPTPQNILNAREATLSIVKDPAIEVYFGITDVTVMNSVGAAIQQNRSAGFYRFAWFSHNQNATIADVCKLTDSNQQQYVRSSFVGIKYDPSTLGYYVAKEACTPYYITPSYEPYRALTLDMIQDLTYSEIDQLLRAGIVPDYEYMLPLASSGKVKPVRALATSYAKTSPPADAARHVRRNADYQFRQIDLRLNSVIGMNDSESDIETIREMLNAYLEGEKNLNRIKDYNISVSLTDQPHTLYVVRMVKPVRAIKFIVEKSIIKV
jgi:hypothetical protein